MTSSTSNFSRQIATLLAALLPVGVFGAYLAVFGRPIPREPSAATLRFDTTMTEAARDVVLLGASKIGTDIDRVALGAGLGLSKKGVASMGWSGTTAPIWYAIAENRVFRAGHRPKLVVVYSTLGWTLNVTLGELERSYLMTQIGELEPELDVKVLHRDPSSALYERVRERRAGVRDGLTTLVRDATVGVLFRRRQTPDSADEGPLSAGLLAEGRAVAAPALEKLFGLEAGIDLSQVKRVIPVAEAARAKVEATASHVEDTLVPDFIRLATAHGARIVFVNAPVRASLVGQSAVDPALLRETVEYLNAHGAGYIDAQAFRLPDSAFGDGDHLSRVGRERLTRALVGALADVGALSDGPMRPARVPIAAPQPTITRTGSPPAFPAITPKRGKNDCDWMVDSRSLDALNDLRLSRAHLGMVSPITLLEDGRPLRSHAAPADFNAGCKGAFQHQDRVIKFSPTGPGPDAANGHTYTLGVSEAVPVIDATQHEGWWVYPGTTLTLAFAEGWPPDGPRFVVTATALALGGSGGEATMTVTGSPVTTFHGAGEQVRGVVSAPSPNAAWNIEFTSPPAGPWVLLKRVSVGDGPDARTLIGAEGGTSAALLGGSPITYATAPAVLPPLGVATPGEGELQRYDISGWGVPDTRNLFHIASVAGCSPIRVASEEPGASKRAFRVTEAQVRADGGYAHVGGTLLIAPGSAGETAPEALAATLDPTRRCRGLRWMYPGDTLTLAVKPASMLALDGDPTRLEIGGAAVVKGASDALIRVRLFVGEEVRLDETFPITELNRAPPSWSLTPPLPREHADVRLELSSSAGDPWVLLTSVTLSEDADRSTPPVLAGNPVAAEPAR